jgi:hypothetical protein
MGLNFEIEMKKLFLIAIFVAATNANAITIIAARPVIIARPVSIPARPISPVHTVEVTRVATPETHITEPASKLATVSKPAQSNVPQITSHPFYWSWFHKNITTEEEEE